MLHENLLPFSVIGQFIYLFHPIISCKKNPPICILKGLSHEIDLKNFDTNLTELDLTKGRGCFLNFLEAPMILKCKK
jgi:hypothetical protein